MQVDQVADVNQRLQDGWVILAIATGHRPGGEPWIQYVMGLPYEDEDEEDEEEGEDD
ncbi:hypothetical protein [Lysobacter antibioticus]|uniref:hypothetical protein n=1 Tax=Lysobacter antibioticus TaxID=84531 RepID=UPI001646C1A8|nr:hypothetical protein [Lysobacter antibioticus]